MGKKLYLTVAVIAVTCFGGCVRQVHHHHYHSAPPATTNEEEERYHGERADLDQVLHLIRPCDTGDLSGRLILMRGGYGVRVNDEMTTFGSGSPFHRCVTRRLRQFETDYGIRGFYQMHPIVVYPDDSPLQ